MGRETRDGVEESRRVWKGRNGILDQGKREKKESKGFNCLLTERSGVEI